MNHINKWEIKRYYTLPCLQNCKKSSLVKVTFLGQDHCHVREKKLCKTYPLQFFNWQKRSLKILPHKRILIWNFILSLMPSRRGKKKKMIGRVMIAFKIFLWSKILSLIWMFHLPFATKRITEISLKYWTRIAANLKIHAKIP